MDLNKTVKVADIVKESVVDGIGFRFVIFTQGCPHRCEGCHNPQTHSFNGGREFSLQSLIDLIEKDPILDGVTFSGGEPFVQAENLSILAKWIHSKNLNVWCYTGYKFEELTEMSKVNVGVRELLNEVDILVDGKFILNQLDLKLPFKGSTNQRILDVNKSLKENKPILLEQKYI